MNNKFILGTIGTLAGVAGILSISSFVYAQTAESTDSVKANPMIEFSTKLAENLGISEDTLKAATKETNIEIIDEKIASGEITAEQGEEIKTKINESDGYGFMFGHHLKHHRMMPNPEKLAEFLGITTDELNQYMKDGKQMDEILEAEGKTKVEFKEFMDANRPSDAPKMMWRMDSEELPAQQ